jgi:hypothetical protein
MKDACQLTDHKEDTHEKNGSRVHGSRLEDDKN